MGGAKDHYVPVFYLKGFANCVNPKKDIWKIWIYHKVESKSYYTNIDQTLYKRYFYNFLDEENKNISNFDKGLERFESKLVPFIKKCIEKTKKKVTFKYSDRIIFKKKIKNTFSEILAVQLMRTEKTREILQFMVVLSM